jgi:hypothetical protein
MAGHGEKLSRKQDAAVAALLSCPTVKKAAERAGIHYRTLKGWLQLPGFQRAYRDAKRRVVEQGLTLLQRTATRAAATLKRNLTCGNPAVEVRAALGVLDQAQKGIEMDELVARIEALEAVLQKGKS